jgi:hypothetical protein
VAGSIGRGIAWAGASPFVAFPASQIMANARFIRDLARLLQAQCDPHPALQIGADWQIDLEATAAAMGISVEELEALLRAGQKRSARIAYAAFALGWMTFSLWVWRLLTIPHRASFLLPVLEFLPFCALFFIVAFSGALKNYQLRTRRLARAAEYLATETGFWPR